METLKNWVSGSSSTKDEMKKEIQKTIENFDAERKAVVNAVETSLAPATPTVIEPTISWNQQNFVALVDFIVKNIDFSGNFPGIQVPKTGDEMLQKASESSSFLPKTYQESYSAPLLSSKAALLAALQQQEIDMSIMETLCAPIYQNDPSFKYRTQLQRYQSVLNSLYDAFLSKQKRAMLNLPLKEQLSPLAMWQCSAAAGPFTLPVDAIEQITGGDVGVVSMPASYMDHPVLWASLGHETGGHDVLHADTTLLPELKSKLQAKIGTGKNQFGKLWAYWIDETASDVYGILNYGPAFTMNLGFFFGALNKSFGGNQFLRSQSYVGEDGQLDPHPTDVLRVGVALGVISNLPISDATKKIYTTYLEAMAAFAVTGQTDVKLQESNGKFDTYSLKSMLDTAKQVGAYISSVKLDSLNGKAVIDIETWTDADETTVMDLARQLLNGEAISTLLPFDIEHLISAASIAISQMPGSYNAITSVLNQQLDIFVKKDPFWGQKMLRPHKAYVRQSLPMWYDVKKASEVNVSL